MTIKDKIFLERLGVDVGSPPDDGTAAICRECGVPVTWENWLTLQTAGHPDIEIDGEMEALIAEWAQDDDDVDEDE